MTKLKWNKYFATTNRRQNILIEHTLREKNFCVKYNRGANLNEQKKKRTNFVDQNLGDTNVMYHKLLDQYYRSQSIKVSINIGIKQNLRTQLSGT